MKVSKKIIVGALVVVAVGVVVMIQQFKPTPDPTTVHPEKRNLVLALEVSGSIDAKEKADLHFATLGRLSWVGIHEGDRVKKWQTIATVDTRTMQKQLQQDLNLFEKAMRANDQQLDDVNYYGDQGLTLELKRITESSQFDLRNSALAVEIQDLAIKLSSLISPIDGVVTHIDKPHAGENVSPTDTYEVVNPKSIYFNATVDEIDIAHVSLNQPATIELDAYPEQPFNTHVEMIEFAPSSSKNGGTGYAIHLPIPEASSTAQLRLGMNGTTTITLQKKDNVLSLPIDALISRENKTYVELWENKKKVQREVQTGLENDEYVEILSGIDEQSAVVLPESSE